MFGAPLVEGGAGVSGSIEPLKTLAEHDDSSSKTWEELEPLWVDAINTRFQECRGRIRILDQLAERAGIDKVASLADAVPLLFAHTAYKSYPESFIDRGWTFASVPTCWPSRTWLRHAGSCGKEDFALRRCESQSLPL
jgi:hypothetical protein